MRNLKLTLQWEGTHYHGWQIQPSLPTIQGELQKAIFKVLKEKPKLIGASRTDAGVHSKGQVANFFTSSSLSPSPLLQALNSSLPPDIRVKEIEEVPLSFNARRDALSKTYEYLIYNASYFPPFFRNFACFISSPLEEELMKEAASLLLGKHDFSAFESQGSPSPSPICELKKLKVRKKKEWIKITLEADFFLYRMARNIVGALLGVGKGKIPPSFLKESLKKRDRTLLPPPSPPQGLYLVKVNYPPLLTTE